jgi:hypothetical protein
MPHATIRSRTRYIHPAAALCLLVALAFYVASWSTAAIALTFVGAMFELAAWIVWFGGNRDGG